MAQDTQRLKAKIISALDFLPLESLKLLAEFVTFLQAKAHNLAQGAEPSSKPQDQLENPIRQLGSQPVVEEVTDASINHDT
jgi:hypothetical protein